MASRCSKSMAAASATAIFCSCILIMASAELQRVQQHAKMDGSLSLLIIGDWGRRGLFNQSLLAVQMGRIGEKLDIDFVISTGDNFYHDGLSGVDDKLFDESFSNVYTAKSLQKPWYAVLGNHDYHGNTEAQLSPILRTIDNRWFCMRSYILDAEIVEFFFVDTTPFVMNYWTDTSKHYNWKGVAPRDQYISNLLKDLDRALKTSTAKWKFVVGHHTMRSVSNHGDTKELIEVLLPILKANDIDMYINGHDHCLEHISSRDSPIQFFTSGGGSKAWKGIYRSTSEKLQFFYDGQGFMSMQLTKADTKVAFYDISGNVLHQWSMAKQHYSSM